MGLSSKAECECRKEAVVIGSHSTESGLIVEVEYMVSVADMDVAHVGKQQRSHEKIMFLANNTSKHSFG